jgi:hypothetical protein
VSNWDPAPATPVREALLDLTKEGLVESERNKGFRVTEVTDQQLDDTTELRTLIEVPMVTRLAPPTILRGQTPCLPTTSARVGVSLDDLPGDYVR